MRKAILLTIVVVVVLPVLALIFLWASYVSDLTDNGSAYGLSIGDSKTQTFQKLEHAFNDLGSESENVLMAVTADDAAADKRGVYPGATILIGVTSDQASFQLLSMREQWIFYFDESRYHFLRLSFCEEKLCRIYRHRQYFELP